MPQRLTATPAEHLRLASPAAAVLQDQDRQQSHAAERLEGAAWERKQAQKVAWDHDSLQTRMHGHKAAAFHRLADRGGKDQSGTCTCPPALSVAADQAK